MAEEANGNLGDVKFNSQAYLNSYMDQVIEIIRPSYKHIFTLNTENTSLAESLALLNGKSESNPIANLKTYQYNSLIPKIRLYRVNYDNSEYEFIFNKDHRYTNTSILNGDFIVGNNCGIKSINWILAGTNPVSAEKTIEVKVEFYFDSIAAFSGGNYDEMLKFWNNKNSNLLQSQFDDSVKKTTTNFWSLIYHPGKKPDEYDTTLFRIKAIVGWESIDPLIISELFKNKENINESLFNSDLIMYLNLVQHSFAFNEDGSIKLTANYIASIENSFSSTRYDLLKGLKQSLLRLETLDYVSLQSLKEVESATLLDVSNSPIVSGSDPEFMFNRIASNEGASLNQAAVFLSRSELESKIKFLSYLNNNKTSFNELVNDFNNCNQLPQSATTTSLFQKLQTFSSGTFSLNGKLETQIQQLNERLDLLNEELDAVSTKLKIAFYSRLIKKIISPTNGEYQFHSLRVNEQQIKDWLLWKNNRKTNLPNFSHTIYSNGEQGSVDQAVSILELQRGSDEMSFLEKNQNFTLLGARVLPKNNFSTYEAAMKFEQTEEEKEKEKTIHFTTVGHIIDGAFKVVEQLLTDNEKNEFYKNKLVLSTFSNNKSIASIPIHLTSLIKFMNEVFYERSATQYGFFEFVKELVVKVVEPALESREVPKPEVNKYSNVSISSTIVSLGSSDGNHPLSLLTNQENNEIDLTDGSIGLFRPYYLSNSNKNKGLIPYNYFIIYDRFNKDFKGIGHKLDDEKRGIYHFTVAQDYGLVKSINFKKIDQPFLKESKSVGKKTIYLGQFRDLYNADIKMIGNNLFHPGMMLFIKPTVEFGNVISTNSDTPTFAQITGVGGYYTVVKVTSEITDESYTTTLDCVFHSNDGLQPQESERSCNLTELEKAGLLKSDGGINSVSPYFINLLEQLKKDEEVQKLQEALPVLPLSL